MAGRGRTTFQKRQKEQLRLERRQQKAAKRLERKAVKDAAPPGAEFQLEEVAPEVDPDTTEQPAPETEVK